MNLFKDYYCYTYIERKQGDSRKYLFINRLDTDEKVTSFCIENEIQPYADGTIGWILIKYNAQWETYAPLIVEYVVNDMQLDNIYLDME